MKLKQIVVSIENAPGRLFEVTNALGNAGINLRALNLVDTGAFGKIPYFIDGAQKIVAMRKVAERPFNLIKHRDGLEPLRTKGIHNSTVVATIANIATLLIEIAGHRKK